MALRDATKPLVRRLRKLMTPHRLHREKKRKEKRRKKTAKFARQNDREHGTVRVPYETAHVAHVTC